MADIIGLIGIIVALVLFLLLVYKGWSSYWVAPLCALIVAVTNKLNLTDAITNNYIGGLTELVGSLFSVIFLGAILGKAFTDTGAAASIATTLNNKFIVKKTGDAQVRIAILVLIIIAGCCTMGGIDGFILLFTMFPVVVIIAKTVDIPRRFIPAMLGVNAAFMAAPGAPQIDNIMAQAALGSVGYHATAYAGLIPGIIAVIIIVCGGFFALTQMIIKAKRNGEHFDYGNIHLPEEQEGKKLPNFFVALLPLIAVFVCYTIIGLNIFFALLIGIIVNLVFMGRYLPLKDEKGLDISLGKSIIRTLNTGAGNFPNALVSVITPAGLATVITATAAFGVIAHAIGGMQIHYIFLTLVAVAILVAITSSPPVALMVGIPIVVNVVLASGGTVDVNGIARIGALASNTFSVLPFNGLVIVALGLAGTTHKESYKSMFYVNVLWTSIGAVAAAVLIVLFPGLA